MKIQEIEGYKPVGNNINSEENHTSDDGIKVNNDDTIDDTGDNFIYVPSYKFIRRF